MRDSSAQPGEGIRGTSHSPFQGTDLKNLLNYGISAYNISSLSIITQPEMRREVNNLFNDQFNYNFRTLIQVEVRIMPLCQ